jgi:hypothetical protein
VCLSDYSRAFMERMREELSNLMFYYMTDLKEMLFDYPIMEVFYNSLNYM